jgi:N-acetyl-anhydromuramyl-L-alanine amidase AmpD
MAAKLQIQLQNRLRRNDSVEVHPATVEVVRPGGNLSAEASRYGEVSLDLSGLADGSYTMVVTPDNTHDGPVDSTFAEMASPPERIYRTFQFEIRVVKGAVAGVTVTNTRDGDAKLDGSGKLIIGLQPVWLKAPAYPRGGTAVRLIVVHETSGPVIGTAINTALESGNGPHYEIDTDGQIVKFVRESDSAGHAGPSQWNNLGVAGRTGVKSVNPASIGIEVVHKSGDFKEAQYVALLDLLEAILKANPDIPHSAIVGHCDVLTTDAGDLLSTKGDRDTDPGPNFDWPRLEAKGLGMIPDATTRLAPGDYAGFFELFPGESLMKGDDDSKSFYGNKTKEQRAKANPKPSNGQSLDKLIAGSPVAELQADLRAIGYFVGNDRGNYGPATAMAVDKFQRHFFTNQRPHVGGATGRLDRATAEMIKKVRP